MLQLLYLDGYVGCKQHNVESGVGMPFYDFRSIGLAIMCANHILSLGYLGKRVSPQVMIVSSLV